MALAADEERALSRIEEELRRSDPKLAAKLAMFNRLTRSEAMPQRELVTAPGRLRRLSARAGVWTARWRLFPPVPSRGTRLTPPPGPATRPGSGAQPHPGHLFNLSPRPSRLPSDRPGDRASEHSGPAPRRCAGPLRRDPAGDHDRVRAGRDRRDLLRARPRRHLGRQPGPSQPVPFGAAARLPVRHRAYRAYRAYGPNP